jgi:POT family proton-dependent oligopeptide transporter
MSIGLVVYLFAQPMLPRTVPRQATSRGSPMTRADWRRIGLLVAAIPLFAAFWVAQSQVWNTYNLWVRDHLQLQMGAFRVPVPWLQSIDGLAPLVSLPLILAIWGGQARRGREPDEFGKIALGCFLFAAGTVWLACGQFVTDASGRTPFLWAVVFHIVSNLGWVYFAPTANAFFSRAAPVAVTATVMSFYSLAVSLGSVISGRLGGLYEHLAPVQFWTLHAAIVAAGGVAVLIYGAAFRRRLFGGQGT